MMTKQDFIALADLIREHRNLHGNAAFSEEQIEVLAKFCQKQNRKFSRDRWLAYIRGENGRAVPARRRTRPNVPSIGSGAPL